MRGSILWVSRWVNPFRHQWTLPAFGGPPNRVASKRAAQVLLPRISRNGVRCFSSYPPAFFSIGHDSTIYALSTAPGRAAIAVIRVSGSACVKIYQALCPSSPLPKPRVVALRTLYDPTQTALSKNSVLDAGALVLYFPGPKTVTGEEVLELHVHGGPAIVRAVLGAIDRVSTPDSLIRYAEPGEFTRRAFMNDRLDLPQIEALGDTLHADTEQQRRLAVRGANDALSKRYEQWRHQLLYARGELEALIDFSEDQYFDESTEELVDSVASQVRALQQQLNLHIHNASKGELLRNGIKLALLGAPNAGKSSLLNQIVGKEAAIVSAEEGTTRDIVDVGVDIGGWYCKLGDMAGIRSETNGSGVGHRSGLVVIGAVEKEGIRRAKARAMESDVVIVVLSLETNGGSEKLYQLSVEPEVLEAAKDCVEAGKCLVVVVNKCDRIPLETREATGDIPQGLQDRIHSLFPVVPANRIFAISCLEAQGLTDSQRGIDPGGIQTFLKGLVTTFETIASPVGMEGDEHGKYDLSYWEDSLGVTHRQSSNLQRCLEHLDDFLAQTQKTHHSGYNSPDVEEEVDIVLAAEHLRFAADSLAKITGKGDGGDVEDVLGVVFEKFCVGK
ncbi:hypothetical protein ASPZODRAFT_19044 [Penicilliopsis zonata CBS 506.65]|uniref:Uncharacterized protein n=1 Tax=Penicilliopsis zonata CBS 506.65 TaxID=1073090 RepID=A0A1L9S9B0_9EURO|nr:hypothetical protein ASPZODRAFT_19044 [Penicilliopsis zonata CBS 506.65]OJJ43737.1 hypothetical protein ASPZODRAFT_19044 [Penicilliopsis zonata CBS 506.65]